MKDTEMQFKEKSIDDLNDKNTLQTKPHYCTGENSR